MDVIASIMNFGGPDLIVILLIVLVLFGAKKLPELARGMGQAVKEFQKAKDEFTDEIHNAGKTDTAANKPVVQPAPAALPRIENLPSANDPREVPNAEPQRPDRDYPV